MFVKSVWLAAAPWQGAQAVPGVIRKTKTAKTF